MNVKRFFGRNSREAMQKVRQTFGDNAVILSTKPSSDGVEVVAMPAESIDALERHDPPVKDVASAPVAAPADTPVQDDVGTLAMSTLSFQDYVRERMLKKRKAELGGRDSGDTEGDLRTPAAARADTRREPVTGRSAGSAEPRFGDWSLPPESARSEGSVPALSGEDAAPRTYLQTPSTPGRTSPGAAVRTAAAVPLALDGDTEPVDGAGPPTGETDMLAELRSMKRLIEDRFNLMAFMDRLQRNPRQVQLSTRLLECGFSPALVRELVEGVTGEEGDELTAVMEMLQRNLLTGEDEPELEEAGGVFALIGSTGVGKTTSTAKLATAFATRHGPSQLGLITLDAYRIGAHEQLRAHGRILGVPVHTAHDRAALEDLLDLLSSKRMVLIDTAGLAQRDARTRELLEMLSHRSIQRLLVVNAAQQAETLDEVLNAYKAGQASGIVLSKLDEAVKLGPAVDAMIRHRLKVLAVSTGQRVPEDWHHLNSQTLVQRALRGGASQAWRMGPREVSVSLMRPGEPGTTVLRRAGPVARSSLGA
jgi:flagellar biosynthesis protein FlhF